MENSCPLCGSSNAPVLEMLPFALLRRLYRKQMKIDLQEKDRAAIELRRCGTCDLRFYVPALSGDERFYESLQKFDWYYVPDKDEYSFAAQFISPEDRVLEIGGGRGAFSAKIKPRSYEGLELSEAAAAEARARGAQIHKCSIEEHTRDHAEGYDVVCSFQVLEHIPNTRSFIESSLKCLKRGGKMIHSVPSEDGFIGRQSNNVLNMPPHHATRWTDKALRNVAELFDLQVIALGHEVLSDLHVRAYSVTLIENCLNHVLGRRPRPLDAMLNSFLVKAPVRLLSRFLEVGLNDKKLRPAGHSVTVVYQKP
jgi:2-polyprenyl-3-methyl-5-hydroxy-6-metoxy-1,4-benzoquinol methylase